MYSSFFTQSVHIKLALPKTAQQVENQRCCTSMRDLIKDTPLIDTEKEREEKKPSTRRD